MSEVTLPQSWVWTTLGEICSHPQYGYTTKAAESGDTLFLRTTDITSGKIDWATVPYCAESPDDPDKYQLHDGDIVISRAGSVGFSYLVQSPPKAVFASYLIRFRPFIDRQYFALFLKSPLYWRAISDSKSGIAVGNVNAQKLAVITIPLPPLAEQKRIVAKIEELFSELEAGEASLRKARRQLGVYRQSLLKQAFEGKLTQKWRTQNPDKLESAVQLLARIQSARQSRHEQLLEEWKTAVKEWESAETEEKRPPKPQKLIPISESIAVFDTPLPESWASLNLSQFVLELGQGWSPKCENREAQGDEWSVIKTTAIQFGNFDPSANKALPKHLPPRRWLGLRSGEILITRAGPRSRCGVVCRVRADHPRLMICDKAYRLVLFEGATSSEFLELLLCSPAATTAIEKLKTGISDSGVNITQSAFLQLALPIPPLPEQQEIVRLLDEQFEAIERNERELDAALKRSEALRQSILKKAFSGRLVPQDPADEPASVLLVRLRAGRESSPSSPTRRRASNS